MSEINCHCGESVYTDPGGFTRGLCLECSTVRCDAPSDGVYYECMSTQFGGASYPGNKPEPEELDDPSIVGGEPESRYDAEFEWSGEKTFAEVYVLATSIFPDAQVSIDNDGQWIVYTNLHQELSGDKDE